MRNKYVLPVCLIVSRLAIAQTGAVSGTVTDQSGGALAGATVMVQRLPAFLPWDGPGRYQLPPGESYYAASTVTDANGNYFLQSLPPGDYMVCVSADQPALDPCKWSSPPPLSITSQSTASLSFTTERGVFLRVRINDPMGLLPVSDLGPLSPVRLIVGVVFGTGASLAALPSSADASGQTYSMPIPTGFSLGLLVKSGYLSLSDQNGTPIASTGTQIPFQAAAGVDQTFTINVTGKLPAVSQ